MPGPRPIVPSRRRILWSLCCLVVLLFRSGHAFVPVQWSSTAISISRHNDCRLRLRAKRGDHKAEKDSTTPPTREVDMSLLGDLTGGRPGAVIETEEQLTRKQEIFDELASTKVRKYDSTIMQDYGELEEEVTAVYDSDDPTALDASTLGTWTIRDLQSKFSYEWDPESGEPDPNMLELQQPGVRYKAGVDVDPETGIDVGYDPLFGHSSPLDDRTVLGTMDSYMTDARTKNNAMLPPQFPDGDLEIRENEQFVQFRKSLDIIETYTDAFLPPDMDIPRHVATWHGYPEPTAYPKQDESNNRFLPDENRTDFTKLDSYQARRKAVELARSQNADWLPPGKSRDWHDQQRAPYEQYGTLVGSLRPGPCDATLVASIRPALDVLGSVTKLLSIEGGGDSGCSVYRFEYFGLMKHKHGMEAWTETLIRDCGVAVTGVIFETGFRRRDQAYDGGDCWYPPSSSLAN